MNLLDTASLVITPNGYKASKLYSIVPSDGSGDMTFARTGDTATRVNSSGLIETVLANKPRLDYTSSTCPKLLLEPQRTNLTLYSEQLDNAYWAKTGTTITANATASPSGSVNADQVIESATNADHAIFDIVSYYASGTTYTTSFYAKANGRTKIDLTSASSGLTPTGRFDLSAVTATATSTSFGAKIESVGNGWYRCSVSRVASSTGTDLPYYMMVQSFGTNAYLGNGTSGVYLWGMQTEAGAYATSYIPTTTASVTRNADSCSKTAISSLIGQTEGTFFVDANFNSRASYTYMFVKNAALTKYIGFFINNSIFRIVVFDTGGLQAQIDLSNSSIGRAKLAIAYKSNDIVFYVNGALVGTDTSATIPTCDEIDLYYNNTNNISINSTSLWKTRLQNSELATLTSL